MAKKIIQNMSVSIRLAKLNKKKCYGHYCNLCQKYNYPRLNYYEFIPMDIMHIEYKFLDQKRKTQNSLIQ